MSMPHEQAGDTARSAIAALKGNPLCLSLLILVIVLSVIAYWRESAAQKQRTELVQTLIERCGPLP